MLITNYHSVGLLGITCILLIAFLLSNNKKAINVRLVCTGLAMQVMLAVFILKIEVGQQIFRAVGDFITKLLQCSDIGAAFAFGPLVSNPHELANLFGPGADYIFAFRVVPTIIFVSTLVSVLYYLGIMQKFVQFIASLVALLLGASGSEALSNAASIFVGQVEAQLLIKPYVATMTMSELLASMSGSMACIAGSVLTVYVGMGIKASYLLSASLMAAPGALVIAKIVYPETKQSPTKGKVTAQVKSHAVNAIDAAAIGATDGLRVGLNVVAMVIAFLALIALIDYALGWLGKEAFSLGLRLDSVNVNLNQLTLKTIFGTLFAPVAWLLGVPTADTAVVGRLMGEKLVVNEFVAYADLSQILKETSMHLSHRAETIATFALCGFANFASVAIQIGGIGEIAPARRHDLARLGMRALLCGSLASYLSASIAGLLTN